MDLILVENRDPTTFLRQVYGVVGGVAAGLIGVCYFFLAGFLNCMDDALGGLTSSILTLPLVKKLELSNDAKMIEF